jgi:hypothetical protein
LNEPSAKKANQKHEPGVTQHYNSSKSTTIVSKCQINLLQQKKLSSS